MYSITDFESFLGLGSDKIPGSKAVGIVVVTQTVSPDTSLTLPKNTRFDSSEGLKFFSTEEFTISESASFLPVTLQAQNNGSRYNIPANSGWSSPQIGGVSLSNPQPFSNGVDEKAEIRGFYPQRQRGIGPKPEQLQRVLILSVAFIRGMLGLLPSESFDYDDVRIKEAVFMLAMYRLQNTTTQELVFSKPTLHATSPTETRYFRERIYPALKMQIGHLLAHKYKYQRIINYEATT